MRYFYFVFILVFSVSQANAAWRFKIQEKNPTKTFNLLCGGADRLLSGIEAPQLEDEELRPEFLISPMDHVVKPAGKNEKAIRDIERRLSEVGPFNHDPRVPVLVNRLKTKLDWLQRQRIETLAKAILEAKAAKEPDGRIIAVLRDCPMNQDLLLLKSRVKGRSALSDYQPYALYGHPYWVTDSIER